MSRTVGRRLLLFLLPLVAAFGAARAAAEPGGTTVSSTPGASARPVVRVFRLEGMIHGVTAEIVERALEASAAHHETLFVLEMDTPGGLVDSTEEIIRAMLNSPVPIAAWVGPRGAHAASAGFFLLLASDVATMAPVTRTGASSVITLGGENREGDIALKKASNDLQALIRSIAREHGRPVELAEEAVKDARSWSAEEALESKLIDLIVADRGELLRALDGRSVHRPDGHAVTIRTAGATIIEHRLDWGELTRNVVLHPTILALMLAIAVLGIYVEFTHPGLVFPGVAGAIGLLVFLYGSRVLPVSFLAAALVALGVVAFVLEIKLTSHGMLAIGGAIAIACGLWLLFPGDVPGLKLPLATFLPILLFVVAGLAIVTFLVRRALHLRPTTGREGLVGEEGEATSALAPDGTVFVHGEVWHARATLPVAAGTRVRVVRAEGLLLHVEARSGAEMVPAAREGESK